MPGCRSHRCLGIDEADLSGFARVVLVGAQIALTPHARCYAMASVRPSGVLSVESTSKARNVGGNTGPPGCRPPLRKGNVLAWGEGSASGIVIFIAEQAFEQGHAQECGGHVRQEAQAGSSGG